MISCSAISNSCGLSAQSETAVRCQWSVVTDAERLALRAQGAGRKAQGFRIAKLLLDFLPCKSFIIPTFGLKRTFFWEGRKLEVGGRN